MESARTHRTGSLREPTLAPSKPGSRLFSTRPIASAICLRASASLVPCEGEV